MLFTWNHCKVRIDFKLTKDSVYDQKGLLVNIKFNPDKSGELYKYSLTTCNLLRIFVHIGKYFHSLSIWWDIHVFILSDQQFNPDEKSSKSQYLFWISWGLWFTYQVSCYRCVIITGEYLTTLTLSCLQILMSVLWTYDTFVINFRN